ncbi:MAG: hypothetical protein RMH97_01190 [Verrucomicrobiales bacterium]|nr:hypothetical protein [Verrucomicrobiales bacterium]
MCFCSSWRPLGFRARRGASLAIEADKNYRTRETVRYEKAEQIQVGQVILSAGASYSVEWNDNIYYRPSDAEDDFIHSARGNLSGFWPVTRSSFLSFGIGIGYQLYTEHSELSRLLIAPGSELAWDIELEDFGVTVFDRIEYSQDVLGQPGISGVARFPRLENTVGLRARWHPKRWVFEAGYSHFNFVSWAEEYDYLDRSAEQFVGRAGYRVAPRTIVGIEATAELTDFDSASAIDSTGMSVGPFVQWQLTRDIELGLRGGYVWYSYEDEPVQVGLWGCSIVLLRFRRAAPPHASNYAQPGRRAARYLQLLVRR